MYRRKVWRLRTFCLERGLFSLERCLFCRERCLLGKRAFAKTVTSTKELSRGYASGR